MVNKINAISLYLNCSVISVKTICSYRSLHMKSHYCSLHSGVATLDYCFQSVRTQKIKFTLEVQQLAHKNRLISCVMVANKK